MKELSEKEVAKSVFGKKNALKTIERFINQMVNYKDMKERIAVKVNGKRLQNRLENLRETTEKRYKSRLTGHEHLLHLALKEAEALAWTTGFPELFYPVLAEEKARALTRWVEKQKSLKAANSTWALAA